MTVRFAPTAVGDAAPDNVVIHSNDPNGDVTVALSGTGLEAPSLGFSPKQIDFGDVQVGSTSVVKTITVKNKAGSDLVISSVRRPNQPYVITNDGCTGAVLSAGETCKIKVAFKPTYVANFSPYYILIFSNSPAKPKVKVALSGRGV